MKRLHTEKENFYYNQMLIRQLALEYERDNSNFRNISEYLPYFVFTNSSKTEDFLYANNSLVEIINRALINDYQSDTVQKLSNFADETIFAIARKRFEYYYAINDLDSICSTLQYYNLNNDALWFSCNKYFVSDGLCLNISYNLNQLAGFSKVISNILEPVATNISNWQQYSSLSKREKQVLGLIANGKDNKAIADELFISIHTIRTHRENILKKIGVHTLREAIRFAEAFDLLGI